jgi:hypothetical protein
MKGIIISMSLSFLMVTTAYVHRVCKYNDLKNDFNEVVSMVNRACDLGLSVVHQRDSLQLILDKERSDK